MKTIKAIAAAVLLAAAALNNAAAEPNVAKAESTAKKAEESIYRKTLRATICVVMPDGSGGTGWIVDRKNKLAITCEHVVEKFPVMKVYFPQYQNGRVVTDRRAYGKSKPVIARVVLVDARRDLALIQLDSIPDDAAEMKLADETPEPGEGVHAVGCPGTSAGFWVYSYGKVRQTHGAPSLVETQVPINSGDSGGPLVNDRGELVGVNLAKHKPKADESPAQLVSWSLDVREVRTFLSAPRPKVKSSDDFVAIAVGHRKQNKLQLAEQNLVWALLVDPTNTAALVEVAYIRNESGKHDVAITAASDAIRINEKCAAAHRELGFALYKKGKFELAVNALTKAVNLDPKDTDAHDYLAAARKKVEADGDANGQITKK